MFNDEQLNLKYNILCGDEKVKVEPCCVSY